MRQRTSDTAAYQWWNNALLGVYGDDVVIHSDEPQAGFYKRKLVKGGSFVAAKIWLFSETDIGTGELLDDEIYQCEVDGQRGDPFEQWSYLASNPITEAEYHYLVALREHAVRHEPDHPMSNPRKAVDWLRAPLPIFNRSETL